MTFQGSLQDLFAHTHRREEDHMPLLSLFYQAVAAAAAAAAAAIRDLLIQLEWLSEPLLSPKRGRTEREGDLWKV